jgi:hypothetical protein
MGAKEIKRMLEPTLTYGSEILTVTKQQEANMKLQK